MTVPPVSDPPESPPTDPMAAFAELGRINLSEGDLGQVLSRIAELACQVIPGAYEVSVTLVDGGVPGTPACTGEVAMLLDEKQYATGFGPCLDAAEHHTVNVIADMAAETRWPEFAAAAASNGVHSSLSVGIPVREAVTGALNIYGAAPGAFDAESVALGQTFAGYAAVAMANAHLFAATAALAGQMADAMKSRAIIEQAKGLLMGQQQITADEAFELLSRASQRSNRKLTEIAQAIIDGVQTGKGDSS